MEPALFILLLLIFILVVLLLLLQFRGKDTAAAIRTELSRVRESLTEVQTQAKTRVEMEQQTAESIQRVEMVLAGTKSRGKAGENIVETVFSRLPSEWQVP